MLNYTTLMSTMQKTFKSFIHNKPRNQGCGDIEKYFESDCKCKVTFLFPSLLLSRYFSLSSHCFTKIKSINVLPYSATKKLYLTISLCVWGVG